MKNDNAPTVNDALQKQPRADSLVWRLVAWLLGWRKTGIPISGREYWVAYDRGNEISVFIATADSNAGGGWSNRDTWEDFDGKVIAWKAARVPFYPTGHRAHREPSQSPARR